MPPAGGLTGLTAAVTSGFAALVAAVQGRTPVDLAPLTAQVERVAEVTAEGNSQVESVIGEDSAGDKRVRIDPELP